MAKDLKEMISDGRIKSLVTGENIKTSLDYDTITDRDKEVAETVLNRVSELTEQNVPQNIIKEKIITDFKIKQIPLLDYKKSLFWKYAKDKGLGVTQQGWREDIVNGEQVRIPVLNMTADLDYLDAWVEEILTEASNLKTILNSKDK
jgi:hypothetical protein|tara:strand:+ start:68 stop:508 length:441 start_codon:yes stop_codon:yes gene_type:complete